MRLKESNNGKIIVTGERKVLGEKTGLVPCPQKNHT
jgi:hypothetical protein